MPAAEFHQRIGAMSEEIAGAEMASPGQRIFLPGQMEWEQRERALLEGIEMPEDVLISLRGLAEDAGMDPADYGIDLGG